MTSRTKDTVKHSKTQNNKVILNSSVLKEKRVRGWCWTLNNYTEEEVRKLKRLSTVSTVEKLIFGKEVGKECGTQHLQGYIYWSYGKTLSDMKRINNRLHLEEAKGGYMSQTIYCTKDGDFCQKGMEKYIKALEEEEEYNNNITIKKWNRTDLLNCEKQDNLEDYMEEYYRKLSIENEIYEEEELITNISEDETGYPEA